MNSIDSIELKKDQAALWFLGQAGYIIRSCGKTVVIDPYLSDSVAKNAPELSRQIPVPLKPEELRADIFIVTHDHTDHCDPETITAYRYKKETIFVAPRFAAKKLQSLGVPESNIRKIDCGEMMNVDGVVIKGIFALANEPNVLDTAGYRIEFTNGRSLYHSADTGFCDLLMKALPFAEILLVCINGKWGNLNVSEAVEVAGKVQPRFAIPNHYDCMALNSEDPEIFREIMIGKNHEIAVEILSMMEPFIWGAQEN
jgi:L-ascorbate 6-phosphate lactonase